MTNVADRVTRVAADLVDSAAAEGARQSRSAKQQLDHWARVGRAVSSHQTASRCRVEAALAGNLDTNNLSEEEGLVFNAEISAAIEESLAELNRDRITIDGIDVDVIIDSLTSLSMANPPQIGTPANVPDPWIDLAYKAWAATQGNIAKSWNDSLDSGRATDLPAVIREAVQHLSCLLYTSPSPRDRQKSRMPSSA